MPDNPAPQPPGDARRVYVWYGIAFGALAALALFCWLLLRPLLMARQVSKLQALVSSGLEEQDALQELGGRERAVRTLSLYMRLPNRIAPDKDTTALLLGHCGQEAVPALTAALTDPNVHVRLQALTSLARLGARPKEALPVAIAVLADPDWHHRIVAIDAIREFGPGSDAAIPALGKLFNDEVCGEAARETVTKIRGEAKVPEKKEM